MRIENLFYGFGEKVIFKNFSLICGEENPIVILGPSGCGKTTLLRLIAGLLEPWSGKIICDTDTVEKIEKNTFSFVFQEPRLLPWLTILENILLPIKKLFPQENAKERAEYFLELVSLKDKIHNYPASLSGGQSQRASIARAFTYPAHFILMDEPFQSLDIPLRIELTETTLKLLKTESRFLITVTHDPREAIFLGKRIIVLGDMPNSIIFDENIFFEEHLYAGSQSNNLEKRILEALRFENSNLIKQGEKL